ncbi:MAG TPA: GNAT family N-acetyltransferase [Micromonosporaceae bacterium]
MTKREPVTSMKQVSSRHSDRSTDAAAADIAAADAAADAAARAANVRIREISELAELEEVYRLYDGIWRPDPTNPPITTEMLRALTKAGNYVSGAYDGGRLVGACVGFFGAPADGAMHSHVAGVADAALGRHIGFALKLHQRAWAEHRGVTTIAWTFDPLVSRNAYFNLGKLAADASEYLPNFYGGMNDGINGNDDTDRLLVQWRLGSPQVVAACAGTPRACSASLARARGAVVALARSEHHTPVVGTVAGDTVLVAVPPDIAALRTADPGVAKEWRVAVREVLATLMADGARVLGFDRSGWYVIDRRPDGQESA